MSAIRYGFYLRPSTAMCRAQAEMHDLLECQYGLRVAGAFTAHAPIKGFFKSNAAVEEMAARLNPVMAARVLSRLQRRSGLLGAERDRSLHSVDA